MRLDLVKLNVSNVEFEVDVKLQDEIVEKLLSICFSGKKGEKIRRERGKDLAFVFADDYVFHQKKHYARGLVTKPQDGKKQYNNRIFT
jgi:hypothetical protein